MALEGTSEFPGTSAAALLPTPGSQPLAPVLLCVFTLWAIATGVLGVSWTLNMWDFGDGSPHHYRERPWKPADADVLIWTSCVKWGGIDGNCLRAAANTRGAERGEAGAAAGEGRRERQRTRANILT